MDIKPIPIPEVKPFNMKPTLRKEPPKQVKELIALAATPGIGTMEIDSIMSSKYPDWQAGDARKYLRAYPELNNTVNKAKLYALAEAGLVSPRVQALKAYADGLKANKVSYNKDGDAVGEEPDHKIRIDCANKILRYIGDDTTAMINIEDNSVKTLVNIDTRNMTEGQLIDIILGRAKPEAMIGNTTDDTEI